MRVFLGIVLTAISPWASAQVDPSQCALNLPDIQKMFPIEMKALGNFEGVWNDSAYRGTSKSFQSFSLRADKEKIQLQTETHGEEPSKLVLKDVSVCKSRVGPVLLADGTEIPFTILSSRKARFKLNGKWMPFDRVDEKFRVSSPSEAQTTTPPASANPPPAAKPPPPAAPGEPRPAVPADTPETENTVQ